MAMPERKRERRMEAWDPFREFSVLQERMNELFGELVPARTRLRLLPRMTGVAMPEVESYETDGEVVVKASVPGVPKENLDINVDEESISLHGEMRKKEEERTEHRYYSEMSYGEFDRTIPLSSPVEPEKAQAHLENGVLEVRVPKKAEAQAKMKKVEIK
ncbi:MAG: Hsp20/alpha crystallin family protein [Actinobacteria bacterium]|nr:MAG: Hsp20/alpha crystallin family protein [Actinomycetota bacterium]